MTTIKPRSKTAEKKASTRKKSVSTKRRSVSADIRTQMIREAAYYRAEKRGFSPDQAQQDWYEAELEIDQQIQE